MDRSVTGTAQRISSRAIYPKDCVGASVVSRWLNDISQTGTERAYRARSGARQRSFHPENFEDSQRYPYVVWREALRMAREATAERGYMILLLIASVLHWPKKYILYSVMDQTFKEQES